MTSELPPPDEARWSALFSTLDTDVAPPDAATLAALRARSAQAFTSAIAASPTLASRTMSTMMFRLSAVLLAAAAAVAVMLQPWSGETLSSATTFDKVLAKLRSATSLELRIIKPNETATVWVRSPGLVRYDDAPQQYRIAAGSRLWQIDEAANTVVKADSPWFNSAAEQIDLLALLEIDVTDASRLLRARPREQRTYHGQTCDVYTATLPAEQGPVTIEAFTDRATHKLVGIIARAPDAPHHAPPLAELQLVAFNPPVDDAKFAIAKSLTEDGRLGNVSAAQGVIGVRPLLAKRWTPVCRDLLLKPGDWVRADLRGANAARLTLSSQVELTLGPGALLECISPTQARLHSGVAQVYLPKVADISFELLAPRTGSQKFTKSGKQLLRVDRSEQLVAVPTSPLWLQGFEGSTNNESLGSLIVNLPDGRNAPLAVGYHKVTVEIRDQIARTTIEESFVNHTNNRLEGVFHFPLPADASISGFGMWIGNELVEADVVEKQRAREIYETILREKRDPGLLEWTGGNLFKARVFPIEANSEKRVKIVYTQLLPLRAGRYRYAYSLRSELLQTRPLRELSLQVTVNSALPLKSITCPTHTVRAQQTAHSAQIDFTAQEYTPTRDFELVCELDAQQADLVVIPHRRGDDGYLLVQLSPPSAAGNWQRELLPDTAPQQIVLVCDTSASMDSEKRRQQREFVAAILASLGADDQFNLVAADVNAVWAFPEMVAANAENTAKASIFLDERISLGWTDLDRALQAVLKKSPAKAQVIYIGDGLVTAGDTDPASFVKRFALMLQADKENARTFHAVTTGNTHDAVVLRGLATQGGGSVRAITGEQTPPAVALELLNEIAQPGLRDVNIEFRGVRVAAVYPERLPNLPAGTQQMLVARYLPTGKDQQGEVIVTGQRNGEPVRYVAKLAFADAEAGNGFIPRLWARAHLDQLLAQGQSTAVRDQVIALSEQFHIITPYTSLLVLETDADRERFGVQRRYEMRDGERFFAQGAKAAQTDLLQQQMRRAGDWRVGLRRQVLRQLAEQGRNADALPPGVDPFDDSRLSPSPGYPTGDANFHWGFNSTSGAFGGGGLGGGGDPFHSAGQLGLELMPVDEMKGMEPFGAMDELGRDGDSLSLGVGEKQQDAELEFDEKLAAGIDVYAEDSSPIRREQGFLDSSWSESGRGTGFVPLFSADMSLIVNSRSERRMKASQLFQQNTWAGLSGETRRSVTGHTWSEAPDYSQWFDELFPHLEAKPAAPLVDNAPKTWSPEAIELSRSLLRGAALKKLSGGLELRRTSETFDPVWQRRTSRHSSLDLYSPSSWLTRSLDTDDQTLIDFCHGEQRGIYSLAFLLGCERVAAAADREPSALYLGDNSLDAIHLTHSSYTATVEPAGDHRAKLILRIPDSTTELRLTIDTQKHVVLTIEHLVDGQRTQLITFDKFVELAGSWWAQQSLTIDDKERKLAETRNELTALTPEQFTKRMNDELVAREQVQFVHLPAVPLATARQKVRDGSATFADHLTMLMHYAQLQQWDDLLAQLTAAKKLAPTKPGVRWLRTVLLKTIGRREEARQRLLDEARALAAKPQSNELFLASFLLRQSAALAAPSEQLELLELLKPVYVRQPAELAVLSDFEAQLADVYENLQRHEAALALRKQLAAQAPWEVSRQIDFAQRLNRAGQHAEALAWVERELARPQEREPSEETRLRTAYSDLLISQAKWPQWLAFTTEWIAKQPTAQTAYQQHLSAMVHNNQLEQAHELALLWLQQSCIPGKLTQPQLFRLEAAISFAQGSSYNLSFHRMERRWEAPLATAARHFLRHPHHFEYLPRILDYRFGETQTCDRLRGELFRILRSEVRTLSLAQLQFLVPFTLTGRLEFKEPLAGRKQL
ncbi:MAG TPA: VIT domain-containing protein, partial [Pirellulaceae bacterium]|nr:VIT domain-containing protein [Pirellulaceae bacterium]